MQNAKEKIDDMKRYLSEKVARHEEKHKQRFADHLLRFHRTVAERLNQVNNDMQQRDLKMHRKIDEVHDNLKRSVTEF